MYDHDHDGTCMIMTMTVPVWSRPWRYMYDHDHDSTCMITTMTVPVWSRPWRYLYDHDHDGTCIGYSISDRMVIGFKTTYEISTYITTKVVNSNPARIVHLNAIDHLNKKNKKIILIFSLLFSSNIYFKCVYEHWQ